MFFIYIYIYMIWVLWVCLMKWLQFSRNMAMTWSSPGKTVRPADFHFHHPRPAGGTANHVTVVHQVAQPLARQHKNTSKSWLVVLGRGHSQDMANRSALLKSSRLRKYSHVNTYAEQTISNRASICRNTDSCKYDTRIGGVEIVWKTCKCQMAAIQRFPVIFHLYCPNEKVDHPTLPHIAKLKIKNSKICTLWL